MNTATLRQSLDHWEKEQMSFLESWEKSRWKDYDDSPAGKSLDNVEHAIACSYQFVNGKVEEARNLIEAAERAEAAGDSEEAKTCLDRFHRILSLSGDWSRIDSQDT